MTWGGKIPLKYRQSNLQKPQTPRRHWTADKSRLWISQAQIGGTSVQGNGKQDPTPCLGRERYLQYLPHCTGTHSKPGGSRAEYVSFVPQTLCAEKPLASDRSYPERHVTVMRSPYTDSFLSATCVNMVISRVLNSPCEGSSTCLIRQTPSHQARSCLS